MCRTSFQAARQASIPYSPSHGRKSSGSAKEMSLCPYSPPLLCSLSPTWPTLTCAHAHAIAIVTPSSDDFDKHKNHSTLVDFCTKVFHSRLLSNCLTGSLDKHTRFHLQQEGISCYDTLPFPISDDGLWVLVWITHRIIPSFSFFQGAICLMEMAIALDTSIPAGEHKTHHYCTFLDDCTCITPFPDIAVELINKILTILGLTKTSTSAP